MAEIIDEARRLKASARSESERGQYEAAARILRDAIEALEAALARVGGGGGGDARSPAPAEAEEGRLAAELADLYGMLGGASRKQGDLARAAAAYDRGFRYESDPRYGIVNTYNTLNRLVTRILMRPDSLVDPETLRGVSELEFVDVPAALAELQPELERDVAGVRVNDFWAAGDLAFTRALNGDEQGALRAVRGFASCSPPPPTSAYASYAAWIGTVAELDTPRKEVLCKVKQSFEDGMDMAPGGARA
jgi:tetratricopeptide (TPR) repeat protein